MRALRRGLVSAAVAAALLTQPASAPGAAVTYQADVAHSGSVPDGPNPPLGRKWVRRDLGASVSYPVIGEGKVFVTAGVSPTLLYALNRRTGATEWVREVAALGSPAYDGGRVYVLGVGALDAVSAATGERLWRSDMDFVRGAAPVPDGPFVYASDERVAYAVSADTGLVVQDQLLRDAGFAVVGDRVFVTQAGCESAAAYTRGLARQIWTRAGCTSSGASAPTSPAFVSLDRTVPFERLWARNVGGQTGLVVDALTGFGTEQFGSIGGIAFGGELAFLRREAAIEARDVSSGTIRWRWNAPPAAGGSSSGTGTPAALAGSALVVRDAVWTQTVAGDVVALRRSDGAELFRTSTGGAGPPDWSYSGSTSSARLHTGMAADAEGLIVPGDARLVALGPGDDAPGVLDPDKEPGGATTMRAAVKPRDVEFTDKVVVSGSVNRAGDSEIADQLELQADPYPYGVWERVAGGVARDGTFRFSHRPDRNTRYRVVDIGTAPAVVSKTFQVYVYPRFRLKLGFRSARRTHFNSTIDAPDFLNLSKQRMYVYGLRSRRAVGVRLGSIPIKRVKGTRYRAARTLTTPTGPNGNYFYVCIKLPNTRQLTRLNGRAWGCGRSRF